MDVKVRKYYGDIEVCATCGTGQLIRLRDGMIRKHKREVWENGQWTGGHEHCPGSGQPHIDLVAANNARSTQAETQEALVTTDFKPGQRIVVADGTIHTVVKMSRWANEPLRVEVEGGLQWLAANCEPVPERTDATDRLDQLRAELDRTTAACGEQIERLRAHVPCDHGRADLRGGYAERIPVPARCESGVTYGLWDEYAGGFTYTGDCRYEVAAEAVTRLTDPADDDYDPDGEYKVLAICRDHEEQPADTCEDCSAGDES
ncbi:hypothetical protein [Kitasatospora mediocidica]|uniref:hypothetical protein n=1 Tax=Kitasatospora mediocidica TaxID=58352 RepID=UPI000563D056|nr:hypothetical protein [Kitasatospora mediocidica]